ncbi:hypothetical protein I7I48_03122 [Histoplasma ohiense]|nr:hypothetical protein I7I48_03122 [Histoplasma ohiense (nom. inval.)]
MASHVAVAAGNQRVKQSCQVMFGGHIGSESARDEILITYGLKNIRCCDPRRDVPANPALGLA